MRIEVKCNCGGENKCEEWAIVELQGVIEPQPDFKDRLQNLPIGHLCRPSSQETYTLTVGYHELMGSKVPLKKPFLVLKKLRQSSSSSSSKEQLEVVGIIRHRILTTTICEGKSQCNRFPCAKLMIDMKFFCGNFRGLKESRQVNSKLSGYF
ncbi:hypothetical protein HYC85_001182 [Camellia sinensis]|uniref:Chromosome transmission fidelity protein 8 n=1 Tax=Camellia sinensis TaxID=4442 RepID=A0A7J7I4P6_CAMSI|nr:hypothetical protein HYC85_001182 [Camellia sinensis]